MTPTPNDVHINAVLGSISVAYMQSDEGFVATKAFANIPVQKISDYYRVFNRADWNRNMMKKRAPGTKAERIETSYSTASYFCEEWALADTVQDETRGNADSDFDLDADAAELLARMALINREVEWVKKYFVTGIWTGATEKAGHATLNDSTHVIFWNLPASTPIENVKQAKRACHLKTGYKPNIGIFGAEVWDALLVHPDILARVIGGSTNANPASVNKALIAALFELDEILVMEGLINAAAEGLTESMSYIGGKNALLVYRAPRPGLKTVSGGYTFSWAGLGFGATGGLGARVWTHREEQEHQDVHELQVYYDMKLVAADVGAFILNVVQ